MKNIRLYLVLSLFIISTPISASNLLVSNKSDSTPTSIEAPQWSLKTQSGKKIALAQYKGKPVILHFWATWCPYCKKIQPTLESFSSFYPEAKIALVGISFNEDDGVFPQDELTQRGHKFITAVNGEEVATTYGVRGTPTTFFINASGHVVYATNTSNPKNPRLLAAVKEMIK